MQPTSIAVAVFGPATRVFVVEHGSGERLEVVAGHGDIIFMQGNCQQVSRHGVPPSANCNVPRYSVSLRRDFTQGRSLRRMPPEHVM